MFLLISDTFEFIEKIRVFLGRIKQVLLYPSLLVKLHIENVKWLIDLNGADVTESKISKPIEMDFRKY